MTLAYIISGDTHQFEYDNSDYPASSWTVKYHLVGPTPLTVVATADGDTHVITISAAQSAVLTAGIYNYALRAYSGDTVYTIESGQVQVQPNPASAQSNILLAQRMLTLIEAALTNQLTDGEAMEAISIAGRSISNISRLELIEERGFWYSELYRYKNAAQGGSGIRSIELRAGRL